MGQSYRIAKKKEFIEREIKAHHTQMKMLTIYLHKQIGKLQIAENMTRNRGLNKIADQIQLAQYNVGIALNYIAPIYFEKEKK